MARRIQQRWFASFVLLLAAALPALGDASGLAIAHVRVFVTPNVGISPMAPTVGAGAVTPGTFSAAIDFHINSNEPAVNLSAAASPLFKSDDPSQNPAESIPLNLAAGVHIEPGSGYATGSHGNTAAFTKPGPIIEGFPTTQTEVVQFSASDRHFSQNIHVKVFWEQPGPAQPTGEYGGIVRLTVLLLPTEPG